MHKLVLLRHGESQWNRENRFTGWVDVDLSPKGIEEARAAGRLLCAEGYRFDLAFTSVLKRAIRTLWIALEELDLLWVPEEKHWRLNERHYGALTGLNKAETTDLHGEAQVRVWRRSYDTPPPPLAQDDERHARFDPRYAGVDPALLPATESLKTTLDRVRPCFEGLIAPALSGGDVLVSAHGNSLRALIKMLFELDEAAIMDVEVPTANPLLIELDGLVPVSARYLDADRAAGGLSGLFERLRRSRSPGFGPGRGHPARRRNHGDRGRPARGGRAGQCRLLHSPQDRPPPGGSGRAGRALRRRSGAGSGRDAGPGARPSGAGGHDPRAPRRAASGSLNRLKQRVNPVRPRLARHGAGAGAGARRAAGEMIGRPVTYQRLTQTEVDVICARHERLLTGREGGARANFSYKILENLDLSGRNLADSDCSGAVFMGANLAGTVFTSANLFACDLRRADLSGATLRRADMRGAILRGANLTGADLGEADLREGAIAQVDREKGLAIITHAPRANDAVAANFAGANLTRSKMTGAVAQRADFSDAVLIGARLNRANLRGSRFPGANLEGADISGADLTDADLSHAILVGVNLASARTSNTNTEGALTDAPVGTPIAENAAEVAKALQAHAVWCETGGKEGQPSTFNGADLRGLKSLARRNLTALQARGATLYGMDLEGVELQGAKLEKADLRMACLRGADLRGADLTGARLNNADLRGARIGPLVLPGDRLMAAVLAAAALRYADLSDADLRHAVVTGADLSYARLTGADCRKARFTGGCFTGAALPQDFSGMVEDLDGAVDLDAA
jgi:bisphosphoglycerate-dependent phosphoglycerate mutase family 1